MRRRALEDEWAGLMRAALDGDAAAYRLVLRSMSDVLRRAARRAYARAGLGAEDGEDVVQETLIAIHRKRHTWDRVRPIGPWVSAIARHKLLDALRRRRRRVDIPIDDLGAVLATEPQSMPELERRDIDRLLTRLSTREQEIVRAVSLEGRSAREAAGQLDMTEGAVRVALHRALKALSSGERGQA